MIFYIGNEKFKDKRITNIGVDTALDLLGGHNLIAEDIETTGLDFFEDFPITLIQLGTREDQFVFNAKECEVKKLKSLLEDEKITKINANGIFERNMFRSLDIELNSMFDVLLAFKVYRQGKKDRQVSTVNGSSYIYSLAGMYKELLDVDMKKAVRLSFLEGGKTTLDQIIYAARDVEIFDLYDEIVRKLIKTDRLHKNYRFDDPEVLIKENLYSVTILEMMVQEWFADMKYSGIKISKDKWTVMYKKNIGRMKEKEKELNTYIIDNTKKYKRFRKEPFHKPKEKQLDIFGNAVEIEVGKKKDNRRINWNSNQQVGKVFLEIYKRIPKNKGKQTIGIPVLEKDEEISNSDFGKSYIEYKKLSKLVSSYGMKYFEHLHPKSGRIHFDINQVLNTGRIAPRNPNLAQIPGTAEWRECFISEDNAKIIGADYSGQESQVMADKSGDSIFIDFFKNGDGDSHSMVASRVYSSSLGKKIKISKFALHYPKGKNEEQDIKEATKLYPKYKKIRETEDYIILYDDSELEKNRNKNPLRGKGKILNFFISFGGTSYTLSKEVDIPIKEADELIQGFWDSFPDLYKYFEREKKFALKKGYSIINRITKRRRYYPEWKEYRSHELVKQKKIKEYQEEHGKIKNWKKFFHKLLKDSNYRYNNSKAYKIKLDIEKAGMNSGIQGTAADITKTACILLGRELRKKNISTIKDIKPVNYIHDELLLEALEPLAEYAKELLSDKMEYASSLFNKELIIGADAYIDNYWVKD